MKQQLLATILFSLVCVSLQAKTYATVDGVAITDKDMEILKQSIPNFNYNKLSEQEKEMLINEHFFFLLRKLIIVEVWDTLFENFHIFVCNCYTINRCVGFGLKRYAHKREKYCGEKLLFHNIAP